MLNVSVPESTPNSRNPVVSLGVPGAAALEAAHEDLLNAMADMAKATQTSFPDRQKYTTARWRLSNASRRRGDLWQEIHRLLRVRVGPAEVLLLSRLAAANEELSRASTAHIGRWSVEAIESDWISYCEASRTIRWKMMSIVRHERRDVLPVLERLERAA